MITRAIYGSICWEKHWREIVFDCQEKPGKVLYSHVHTSQRTRSPSLIIKYVNCTIAPSTHSSCLKYHIMLTILVHDQRNSMLLINYKTEVESGNVPDKSGTIASPVTKFWGNFGDKGKTRFWGHAGGGTQNKTVDPGWSPHSFQLLRINGCNNIVG